MQEREIHYEKLRKLLSPKVGVELPKNELVDKLLTNLFTEQEAFIVAEGVRKGLRPVSIRRIRKRIQLPKKELKEKLKDMNYRGKIIKVGSFVLMPPYLPGLFEVYFTNNRDDPERMKKAGEAHYELIKSGFHVKHSQRGYRLFRIIPGGYLTDSAKSIDINKELEVTHQILPFEILAKYFKKQKVLAVQPCSCRTAAGLAGSPCKRTKENFCVSAGFLAKDLIKKGVGRKVSYNELMEILKKAEKAGLVHETTNMRKNSLIMCNCCSCCCGFLKSIKELHNKGGVAISNFQPVVNVDKCKLCETCVKKCPMEVISRLKDSSNDKIVINLENCLGCGVCSSNCPQGAITLEKVRNVKPVKGNLGMGRKLLKATKIPL